MIRVCLCRLLPFAFAFSAQLAMSQMVEKIDCPKLPEKVPEILRSDVYKSVPFKSGEKSVYEVSYMGTTAGTAVLEVRPPTKYNGMWHRVFHGEARTGEWFERIFIGRYVVDALIRPWDSAASKFYLEQNEGKFFSSPTSQMKWLEFDHINCKTHEKVQKKDKPEELAEFDLSYGAKDILGAVEFIRTYDFKIGQKEKVMVYTSEKNWWLEAEPLLKETLDTKAGKFDTVKMKLQTYVGKELQQKGDVYVWYATTGAKPLVQVQAEIKVGSMYMVLTSFTPGG